MCIGKHPAQYFVRKEPYAKKEQQGHGYQKQYGIIENGAHRFFIQLTHAARNQYLCAARKAEAHHKQYGVKDSSKAYSCQFHLAKAAHKNGIEQAIAGPRRITQYKRPRDLNYLFICSF